MVARLTEKGGTFQLSAACETAFGELCEALGKAPVLQSPDVTKAFIVNTDVSDVGISAILSQASKAGEQVIAYYSHALSRTERNYCVTHRELLAVVYSLKSPPF